MKAGSSRRNFLAAGLALPAAGLATASRGTGAAAPAAPRLASAAAGDLKYRTLGKTGLKVTEVGFGCMITSDPSVIEKAADLGINFFDTARGYQGGNNERMLGAVVKGKRKQVYICTKTGARSADQAVENLATSLKELGTDYVDVWCLHARSRADQLTDELLEAQQTAKKAGKIRFAGLSTHSGQADVIQGAIKTGKIDVVVVSYNFTMGDSLNEAIAAADAAGIGVVAMKVMAGGFRRAREGQPLYDTLKREGAMAAALKWVLQNPKVHTTIPSITDMDQLDEDLRTMGAPLTDADRKLLARQLDYIKPLYCRMCGSCEGVCPQGMPVADVLRYLTYAEGYGQFALGREHFLELPEEVAQIRCASCSGCAVQCPNGVRVAERLIRAQELFA